MPIVVEEEKSTRARFITLVSVFLVLGLIGYVAYVLFLRPTKVATYTPPPDFKRIQEIAGVKLDPVIIATDPSFSGLRLAPIPFVTSTAGRANPFIAYEGYVGGTSASPRPVVFPTSTPTP